MLRPWNLEIQIDPQSGKAIYIQIADTIIEAIQSGRLKSGDTLPGSRIMAGLLQVNRNTIVEALNVLLNEGWIVARERKGSFVSYDLPKFSPGKRKAHTAPPSLLAPPSQAMAITFDDGHPDSKIAPVEELARAYRQIFRRKARWKMMGYSNELGDPEFRKALRQMLSHQRGMQVDEHAICITRGSQMAMYLAAHCILAPGDAIMIETPGYKPAWQAFENAGAQLLPVSVDQEGLSINDVKKHLKSGKKVKAVYTTPHRQYPTTATLSLQRRLELISLSNQYGFTIIEDDYDNEFHFGYRPVLPLSSFPELKNYVYIGTMSKVVAPSLRVGYLVSNHEVVSQAGSLRKIIDVQGDAIMEQAILELIRDGAIKRHLKKATAYYKAKRDYFDGLLQKHLGKYIHYQVPEGGLAFWIQLSRGMDVISLEKQLLAAGVSLPASASFSFKSQSLQGLRLGYASLTEQKLEEGIIKIRQVLDQE